MKDSDVKAAITGAVTAGVTAMLGYMFVVRPWHLKWGATNREIERPMAGDELVKEPIHVTTRAVNIEARPEDIWPWLAQMGYSRGGMYSYDWIDRVMGILDEESTWQIMPEHQRLEVGDVIPMGSGPSWPVVAVEKNRSLVLHIEDQGVDVTWSYLLEPLDTNLTRLILRVRTWLQVTPGLIPLLALMDPGEFLMVRKHLLGVKDRAEALARTTRLLPGT
jgi:hypothetical protein